MKKLPGVESVDVSLEKAMTHLELKPGNDVTLAQLRDIIKSRGFNAREAQVTAVGRLFEKGEQRMLDLAPARMLLTVSTGEGSPLAATARTLAARGTLRVEVTGVVKQGEVLSLTGIVQK